MTGGLVAFLERDAVRRGLEVLWRALRRPRRRVADLLRDPGGEGDALVDAAGLEEQDVAAAAHDVVARVCGRHDRTGDRCAEVGLELGLG